MLFEANLQPQYMLRVLDGSKTIEGRINRDKWREMKVGDTILFNKKYLFDIVGVRKYDSFKDLLTSEGVGNVLPQVPCDEQNQNQNQGQELTIEDANDIYVCPFSGLYSKPQDKADIDNYGVVAIELERK